MSLRDQLRQRVVDYEREAASIKPRLLALEGLIQSAKTLLAEEDRASAQFALPVPADGDNPEPESIRISAFVLSMLDSGGVLRFNQIRDAAIKAKYPGKPPSLVGKQVSGVLRRAVDSGKALRLGRGMYKAVERTVVVEVGSPDTKQQGRRMEERLRA